MKKLLLSTLFLFLFPLRALAVTEFKTSMITIYHFDEGGSAAITHQIDLVNNLSHIYPTVYNLSLTSGEISDVKVLVLGNPVAPQLDRQASVTTIHVPIRYPKIGKDQKTTLEISYRTPSFAEKIGDTLTLTLPKTAKGNEAESFLRRVIVPRQLPPLSYSSQAAQEIDASGDIREYQFVGSGDQNLTLHFGTTASYDLKLNYLLKNTTNIAAVSELALPPDTAYQRMLLNSLDPKPLEVVLDSDGNYLARYSLPPLSKLEVLADLSVQVSPNPIYFDPSSSAPTEPEPYWEQTTEIKNLASTLKNPQNLYNYLLETLTYDYSQISRQKRLGASGALARPDSAICTEFTDLFVATSRAMGIPSRAIIGYAVTTNSNLRPQGNEIDILHAYPEYQDPSTKVWRSVDPTWGHTTGGSEYFDLLDFGHIAFVRWGSDSAYPLPAGSYRENRLGKQLEVTVRAQPLEIPPPAYEVKELEGGQKYLINTGRRALINETITLEGDGRRTLEVKHLPPYGRLLLTPPVATSAAFPKLPRPSWIIFGLVLITLSLGLFKVWKNKAK